MLDGKNALITGGGGSISRATLHNFLETDLAKIRIIDNHEPNLSDLQKRYDDDRLRYLAGDIRDADRLQRALEKIDIVIHMAAMKHVNICEYNSFEAVKTNVNGVQNIVDEAIEANVDRIVFTSSDKAANPANTMGATKLLGEKLITAGNKYRGERDIRFASVRFGNVVNSSQSVIPIFAEQIRKGGPVTLTDRRMVRFFLTPVGVFNLITSAIKEMEGGEVFIRKMPAIRIEDLANVMVDLLAPEYGYDPNEIDIEETGKRIGETIHEEIITEREWERLVESEDFYAIIPESNTSPMGHTLTHNLDGYERAEDAARSTKEMEPLSLNEVRDFLIDNEVLEIV